jgi:hypothetical protein
MVWEWSHTQEAYDNVRANIQLQPKEWLWVVYAEWLTFEKCGDKFDEDFYDRELALATERDSESLAEEIWEKVDRLRSCENGGFEAWGCPYGCGCHLVSFDAEG